MTIGVLGGGQLARMMALAGMPTGCRFVFLEPSPEPPVRDLGTVVRAPYDDPAGLAELAAGVDVVTYEFENVPAAAAAFLAERRPVLPGPAALEACQDRLAEKRLFASLGIPTADFRALDAGPPPSKARLGRILDAVGLPAVVKTRRFGYDGKGQATVRTVAEAAAAVERPGSGGFVVERLIPFDRELSVVAVRDSGGRTVFYPLVENHHAGGVLVASWAPAPASSPGLQAEAEGWALRVMERLDYVGVLAVELFEAHGRLLANEMAPRVHNSGHWTLDGAAVSQFENHVRAISGRALAEPEAHGWSAMVNLIGEVPDAEALAAVPGARAHLYDKAPRPGRKLGHVNATGRDPVRVRGVAERVWALAAPAPGPLPAPAGWGSPAATPAPDCAPAARPTRAGAPRRSDGL